MTPKEAAGRRAAEYIEAGMIVGLGTGSTVEWTIRALGERVAAGLAIKAIPTSEATTALARSLDIELTTLAEVSSVDLTIDGGRRGRSQPRLNQGPRRRAPARESRRLHHRMPNHCR